jgi:LDH2 family malate/lactate/ureidoglycolate dehydrogenase
MLARRPRRCGPVALAAVARGERVIMADLTLVPAAALRPVIARIFEALGTPAADASTVAEVLVEADLRGVESHGSTRVAGYASMIRRGLLNPRPDVRVLKDRPSMAMLEGDRAFGIVVARRAMQLAMDKARVTDIACVTVKNVTHTGLVGFYPMMAARAGLIGLAMNNGPRILPPFGGRTPTYATNPFAAAFPAGERDPIVLDMATSVVAGGKLRLAAKKGAPIPPDWALDREGVPTTDPDEAIHHGFMQWAGGYKGFGLATVVEILGGVLSGGLFGTDVPAMKSFGAEPLTTSAFYLAINPEHFMPLEDFRARIDRLVDMVKASDRAAGVEEVYIAGEIEFRRKAERLRNGIPLSDVVYQELKALAAEVGAPFDLRGA